MMARRRPNKGPESQMIPEHKEDLAADRQYETYPGNQFSVAAAIIGAVIVVIGLAVVVGLVKP